jgi:hypothetical protein
MATNRLEFDLEAQRVAEAAVGIGEAEEQVAVIAVRCGPDDLSGTGEHVHRGDRLVRASVAEAGGLDPETGHRAAEGDGAQLWHAQRHKPVRQVAATRSS